MASKKEATYQSSHLAMLLAFFWIFQARSKTLGWLLICCGNLLVLTILILKSLSFKLNFRKGNHDVKRQQRKRQNHL